MKKKAAQSSEYTISPGIERAQQPAHLYTPNSWDIEKLRAFPECFFFTAEQLILYLGKSLKSRTMIQEKLTLLSGNDKQTPCTPYLLRMVKPDYTARGGSPPYVYFLGSKGINLLKANGYDPSLLLPYSKRVRKIREHKLLPRETLHSLAVTDIINAAKRIHLIEPRLCLFTYQHDWLLRQKNFPSEIFKGDHPYSEQYNFHPDGFFEFRLDRGNTLQPIPKRVFVEVDMGSHTSRDRFKRKLAAYIDFFSSGSYGRMLGKVRNYVVAYITPLGEERRNVLRLWTREYFRDLPYLPRKFLRGTQPSWYDENIFRFATVPPGTLDPKETFLHPRYLPAAYLDTEMGYSPGGGKGIVPEPLFRLPSTDLSR